MTGSVVWKEEFDPFDDLTKLSQYARAYSTATIDKALEVNNILKEKDQAISLLQAQLSEAQHKAKQAEQHLLTQQQINHRLNEQLLKEKQRIDSSAIQMHKELSKALAKLKVLNEQMVKSKDEQISQLSGQIEKTKNLP